MRALLFIVLSLALVKQVQAETVVAARNIRHNTVLTPADLAVLATNIRGGFTDQADLVGLETRVMLYAGRPILASEVGPPALIERNQIVTLVYASGPLTIYAEGRSLSRAGLGDRVRVMNLTSRTTISGTVTEQSTVIVSNSRPTHQ